MRPNGAYRRKCKAYEHVKAAGKLLDHELPEQTVGGSGDASYFSYQGVPSVDGLGPYMYKIHSKDESMRLSSMVEKQNYLRWFLPQLSKYGGER